LGGVWLKSILFLTVRMATIVPPPKCGEPIKIKLLVGKKSLKLTKYESEQVIHLYIGGHDLYCIYILLNKSSDISVIGRKSSDALLSNISYNIHCSLEDNFLRGQDTTMILKLAISYIKRHYPYVKTLLFNDASFRTCDNGARIPLSEMSYIRTGETWYQTHFYAYLDSDDKLNFDEKQRKFQELKKTFTWDMMKMSFLNTTLPENEDIMKKSFEDATTWQDFFGPLSDRIHISNFCNFVSPWLTIFLASKFRFFFTFPQYNLPIHKIDDVEFKEVEYRRGGRRFTRKYKAPLPVNEM